MLSQLKSILLKSYPAEKLNQTQMENLIYIIKCISKVWNEGNIRYVICPEFADNAVDIICQNTVVVTDEFVDLLSLPMADIGSGWNLSAMGTADNGETVHIKTSVTEDGIEVYMESMSGEVRDVLYNLTLRIAFDNQRLAEQVYRILCSMNFDSGIIVTDWCNAPLLKRQNVFNRSFDRSFYCYGGVDFSLPYTDYLYFLSFEQKERLWESYLKYGLTSVELDWLADELSTGEVPDRIQWEISLKKVMSQLGYTLVVKDNLFEVFDENNIKKYFSSDGNSSEKAFMKILFPLNYT